MTRRFGASFARLFGSALVHGIYAADSRKLSVRAAFPSLWAAEERGWGSIVRGFLMPGKSPSLQSDDYEVGDIQALMQGVSVFSFRDGMNTMIHALEEHVKQQPNVRIVHDTPVEFLSVNHEDRLEVSISELVPILFAQLSV
jgi:protoporphyrinogen/coproporphyrinogen III oxidase